MDNARKVVLAERYEVGELIGRGGMAEVHIGHDTRLSRTVAIKILRSDLARDPSFLARFRREAQAAASLNHPAIVAVYDTGEDTHTDAQGNPVHVPFIVMEYVEGHTVRDILRDGQAVPIEEAIEITSGVLGALEYSHHAGIVHRDIKPANVMITPTGAIKVMDFGIARAVADSAATMTQTHAVIGTAQYLSPEQARGETVDARSDLYSTGCLLYELLTGRPPFIGDSPVAVAYQHVRETPAPPSALAPDVPEVLDRITLKALAKARDDRYSSAGEFRADLESAGRGEQIGAPSVDMALASAGVGATAATAVLNAADQTPTMVQGTATEVMSPTSAFPPARPEAVAPFPGPTTPSAPVAPRKKSRRGLMITLISIAVVAVVAIVAFALLNNKKDTPEVTMVTVPTVTAGMTPEQAKTLIEKDGFIYSQQDDADSNEPEGTFTKQDPAGGTKAERGSTVKVFFSAGPDSVPVPDLTGKTQSEAQKLLADAGLRVGQTKLTRGGDIPQNNVVATDPAKGTAVKVDSSVTLLVSDGNVDLPDLKGKTQAEAEEILTELGLTAKINPVEAGGPEGTVVAQRPAAGPVGQGSTVELDVAQPDMTDVPDLVGMTLESATDALGSASLNYGGAQYLQSALPKDTVISSNPVGGTSVKAGTSVTLTLSDGSLAPTPTPTDTPTPDPTDTSTETTTPPDNGGQ